MPTREDFLIRDDIIFFNHGSFGACPKPVFARYQAWQLELERQPVDFLMRRRPELMAQARTHLCQHYRLKPLSENQFSQMVTIPLPDCDVDWLQRRLLEEYRIEAPVGRFADQCGIRVSVQACNRLDEIKRLINALKQLIG